MATLAVAVCATFLTSLPTAQAQIANAQQGGFGTQVKVGDFDYTPLLKRTSAVVRVVEIQAGLGTQMSDNCVIMLTEFGDGGAARAAPTTKLYNKDIRVTPCNGQPAGTLIADTDVFEKSATKVERTVQVRYADVDNNDKFSKGDNVYLTTLSGGITAATPGFAATKSPGVWTLRLSPVGTHPAGSFVFPNDEDYAMYHAFAAGAATVSALKTQAFSYEEREGGVFYIVPSASGTALTNQPVPVNAIRVGPINSFTLQPNVIPTTVTPGDADHIVAGKATQIIVTVTNTGTGAGPGVLFTKLAGQLVDARITPWLSPGEATTVLVTFTVPESLHGALGLGVNDAFSVVSVLPPTASASTSQALGVASPQQSATPVDGVLDATANASGATVHAVAAPIVPEGHARNDAQAGTPLDPAGTSSASAGGLAPTLALLGLAGLAFVVRRLR